MPLYTYECRTCGRQYDRLGRVADLDNDEFTVCIWCDSHDVRRVLVPGHGGLKLSEPAWLDDSVRECLQDSDRLAAGLDRPITTRQEHREHLERNGIVEAG